MKWSSTSQVHSGLITLHLPAVITLNSFQIFWAFTGSEMGLHWSVSFCQHHNSVPKTTSWYLVLIDHLWPLQMVQIIPNITPRAAVNTYIYFHDQTTHTNTFNFMSWRPSTWKVSKHDFSHEAQINISERTKPQTWLFREAGISKWILYRVKHKILTCATTTNIGNGVRFDVGSFMGALMLRYRFHSNIASQ